MRSPRDRSGRAAHLRNKGHTQDVPSRSASAVATLFVVGLGLQASSPSPGSANSEVATPLRASAPQRVMCHGKVADYVGTGADDVLTEAQSQVVKIPSRSVVAMRGGDDRLVISGQRVELTICMGRGRDSFFIKNGQSNGTVVDGGRGQDRLGTNWEPGAEMFGSISWIGGPGADSIFSGNDREHVRGGPGADRVLSDSGADVIRLGNGDDKAFGQSGRDHIYGGSGDDALFGGFQRGADYGRDSVDGGSGSDACLAEKTSNCER